MENKLPAETLVTYKDAFQGGFNRLDLVRHKLYGRRVRLLCPIHRHNMVFDEGEIGVFDHCVGYSLFDPACELPVTITFVDENGQDYTTVTGIPWEQAFFLPQDPEEASRFEFLAAYWQIFGGTLTIDWCMRKNIEARVRLYQAYRGLTGEYKEFFLDKIRSVHCKLMRAASLPEPAEKDPIELTEWDLQAQRAIQLIINRR